MKSRFAVTVTALVSALLVAACGGGGTGDAGPRVSAAEESAPPSASGSREEGDAPRDASRKSGRGRGADETELAVLTGVRVGVHGAYDRVVFDFEGGAPKYVAEYVDALHQDGSGEEVPITGEHRMMLVFLRARPERPDKEFGDAGATTPTVRGLEFVGYFEGDTRFGVGVDSRRGGGRPGFRVTTGQNKVVLDIAHAPAGRAG